MRLITRSDFDGLMCAVLLKEVEKIKDIEFVHPKDVQDGKIAVTKDDILTNLPFVPGVGLWFDHHSSEAGRNDMEGIAFEGRFDVAPSAARVVYDHYVAKGKGAKLKKYKKLLEVVDKSDSAQLTEKDVTKPSGWILLSYVMDPRTGLGYSHDYAISNRDLMKKMISLIGKKPVKEILANKHVAERVAKYKEDQKAFKAQLVERSVLDGNVVVSDFRGVADVKSGNRFLVYTLFPDSNVSVRISESKALGKVVCAVGHSIFNRTCKTDVGKLMGRFGGGGHRGAGTCQLPVETAAKDIKKILAALKKAG